MSNGAFGGYDKPNFKPKNLTSDMWEPITTNNNFSAYTPERHAQQKAQPPAKSTRQKGAERVTSSPAKETASKKRTPSSQGKKPLQTQKKAKAKPNKNISDKIKTMGRERPISSGRVPDRKKSKANKKAMSERQLNFREKQRRKINLEYVRLIKRGKTADEARVILTKRKIRLRRIKTFGTVAMFFTFALSFLMTYSYYQGAEISDIVITGDEVYSETEILEAAQLSTGMNMLTVREKQVNNDVTKVLPFISEIGVDYRLPDVLALEIISTKESLILKCSKKYICVDINGKVVDDKKKKLSEGQFLVQGLEEQEYTVGEVFAASEINAERYDIARRFAKATAKAETLNYGLLDLTDLKDITFTYHSKIRLYLGDGDNLESKIAKAIEIMESADVGDKAGYINLKYDVGAYFMEGSMK